MKEHLSEHNIDRALKSLDNISRASAPEGFLDQLESKLEAIHQIDPKWYQWLQVGIAAMVILSLLNGFFITQSETIEPVALEDFTTEYFETTASILNY